MQGVTTVLSADDVLNRLRGIVLVVASDGTIRAAYGGNGTMAGHRHDDIVGRNALEFLAPESAQALVSVFLPDDSVPIVAHPTSFPIRALRPDGSHEDYDLVPTGFDVGGDRGWVVLLTSRHHLPPATEVLHSMGRGESLRDTLSLVATRFASDVPGMPDVVRNAVVVLRPGTNEAECIAGRSTAVTSVIAEHLRRGDDEIWSDVSVADVANRGPDDVPAALGEAMRIDGLAQLLVLRIDAGGRTMCVVMYFITDPNAGGLLGNTVLAIEELRAAITQAIEADEGRRALEDAAARDPLTGLYNRAGFDAVTRSDAGRASAVLYVDLDAFKAVNDTFGHTIGDAVLSEVAGRLRSACRPHDRIARLGGDEFAIVIGDVDHGAVEAIARRLLATIAAPLPEHLGPESVSASIGIAHLAPDDVVGDAITAADLAMLAAKRAGRGRIVSA